MLWSWAYVRGPGCSSRWRPRLGPRLERTQALCEPCVSRRGLSPSVCGRRTLAELHIQDIGPRMLPSFVAPGQGACCRRPCCSFPFLALFAHIVPSIVPASAGDRLACEAHEDGKRRAGLPQVVERELFAYAAEPRICRSRDRSEDLLPALAQ